MTDPAIAKFLAALEETQHLAPERMVAYQRRLLDRLLRHARAETVFYADRLAPLFRADDSIDWQRWTEIPILTRAAAQEDGDAMRAANLPSVAGAVHVATSSGSTGRAVRNFTNDLQRIASACANERFFAWHGLDPMALTAAIQDISGPEVAYPHGRRSTGWRIAHPDSPLITLGISTPIQRQVEWLRRVAPAVVSTYPSNLREIGRIAEEDGRPLHVDAVLTVGETISADMAAEIAHHFGHPPLDQYGSTEIGHVSGTCPHSGKHHIASELVLIEIVDDAGAPVPDGSDGRIVATAFYNYAMPFIRYDTGDLGALAAEPCGCGRMLPLFERILGRSHAIFRFADGTRVSPMLLAWDMGRFVPHRQCQMVQTALDRVELRYVPKAPAQTNDLEGLTAYVRQNLHASLAVDLTAVERIDRLPSGKFADFLGLPPEA